MGKISILTFEDNVFKNVIKECFVKTYLRVLDESVNDIGKKAGGDVSNIYAEQAKSLIAEELNMANISKVQLKNNLLASKNYYAKLLVETAEHLIDIKKIGLDKENIQEEDAELDSDDEKVVENIFAANIDSDHLEEVRDAVADYITEEKNKAEGIKDAIEHDKRETGEISESTMQLIKRTPNSLLESIYKGLSSQTIIEGINEGVDANTIMKDNKDLIIDMGIKVYTMHECIHKFGFKEYGDHELEKLMAKYHGMK